MELEHFFHMIWNNCWIVLTTIEANLKLKLKLIHHQHWEKGIPIPHLMPVYFLNKTFLISPWTCSPVLSFLSEFSLSLNPFSFVDDLNVQDVFKWVLNLTLQVGKAHLWMGNQCMTSCSSSWSCCASPSHDWQSFILWNISIKFPKTELTIHNNTC